MSRRGSRQSALPRPPSLGQLFDDDLFAGDDILFAGIDGLNLPEPLGDTFAEPLDLPAAPTTRGKRKAGPPERSAGKGAGPGTSDTSGGSKRSRRSGDAGERGSGGAGKSAKKGKDSKNGRLSKRVQELEHQIRLLQRDLKVQRKPSQVDKVRFSNVRLSSRPCSGWAPVYGLVLKSIEICMESCLTAVPLPTFRTLLVDMCQQFFLGTEKSGPVQVAGAAAGGARPAEEEKHASSAEECISGRVRQKLQELHAASEQTLTHPCIQHFITACQSRITPLA